jgi:acetyl esterase/lipase
MTVPLIQQTDTTVPGPHGPVGVRIYRPATAGGPGIVWIHGGGFRENDINVPEAHWVSQLFAGAGITVVSVDYRLAVDGVHFPVPSDDCLAAWRWATESSDLGVEPGAWHIGGGSAGANLAASVSLQARDGRARLPLTSVLIYPVLHSEFPAPSAELAEKVASLPAELQIPHELSEDLNINYVGERSLLTHPYAFPGYGQLEGLPPTIIINSETDILRASGEEYGAQLVRAGVDAVVIREAGVLHGHLNDVGSPGAVRTVDRMIDWLTRTTLYGGAHEPL